MEAEEIKKALDYFEGVADKELNEAIGENKKSKALIYCRLVEFSSAVRGLFITNNGLRGELSHLRDYNNKLIHDVNRLENERKELLKRLIEEHTK